jgi:hypothetical protein
VHDLFDKLNTGNVSFQYLTGTELYATGIYAQKPKFLAPDGYPKLIAA